MRRHPLALTFPHPVTAVVAALWGVALGCNGDLDFERGAGAFCDGPSACADGLYCDREAQRCEPLSTIGEPCTTPEECAIGYCAQGHCCNGPCNQACLSCGLEGTLGQCTVVDEGQDPEGQCPGTTVCSDVGKCQGTNLWSRRIGSPSTEVAADVVVDAAGKVIVTGSFDGSLAIGDATYDTMGGRDVFVAAFTEEENTGEPIPIWSVAFGSAGDDDPTGLVLDSQGRPVLVGTFEGQMDVLGESLVATDRDAFVLQLAADGDSVLWATSIRGTGTQSIQAVTIDDEDHLFVGGGFESEIDYGNGIAPSTGGRDAFVARLDSAGVVTWHRELGDVDDQRCDALGVGPEGDVIAALTGRGTIDTGGGSIAGSVEDDDMFLARLDATDGSGGAVLLFGGQGDQSAQALAIDDAQQIWLAGGFNREVDIPGGPTLVGGEDRDGFCAKLSPTGSYLASLALDGPFDDEPLGLAIDPEGNAIVVGRFELALQLGEAEATIDSTGSADLFLLKLGPNAEPIWTQPYGGSLADRAVAVATDADGTLFAVGDFEATLRFGNLPLNAAGATDLFVAKFAR